MTRKKKIEEKKRIDWIDTLRGIGMFLVVWGHSFPSNKGRIRKYIYSFHMPLFFFISGLTYNDDHNKYSLTEYMKKKFKALIVPYIIFNIICYILSVILYQFNLISSFNYIENIFGTFYANGDILFFPSSPTWFLITLFFTEVLFYILKKYSNSEYNLALAIAICGLIGYANSLSKYQLLMPWHLDSLFTAVVFYYLGYIFMKIFNKIDFIFEKKFRMLILGIEFGFLGVVISVVNRRVSMHSNLYGSITLFYFGAIATIFALILFVNLFMKKSFVFKTIGKNSIFYLAYHLLLLDVLKKAFPILKIGNINILLDAIITTVILFPISIVCKKYIPIAYGKIKDKTKIDKKTKLC